MPEISPAYCAGGACKRNSPHVRAVVVDCKPAHECPGCRGDAESWKALRKMYADWQAAQEEIPR